MLRRKTYTIVKYVFTLVQILWKMLLLISGYRWLGSRVVSVLDSNAAGQGRSQGWAWGLKPPQT